MDDKENSVERAYRLMEECDDTVEFLRGMRAGYSGADLGG